MTQYKLAIIALLLWEAVTLCLLWITHRDREGWRDLWTVTAAELLFWKRNAVLRDPKSGKYVKKAKRP
jgi:hypothetical protein